MRDRIHVIADPEIILIEALLVVDVLLRGQRDLGHGLHSLDRIGSCRRLAGEHHRAGSVIDGIGYV